MATNELKFTPIDEIPDKVREARRTFLSQKTKPLEFRLTQLRKLYWGLVDNADAINDACKKDIGRGVFETGLADLDFCTIDVISTCNSLESWAKDEKAPDIPLANKLVGPKIRKDPLGCVLIIGPYNLPVNLLICPLIGAIAAGNTAIIKPSENAPTVAALLQTVIEKSLDPSCFKVVQGAVAETSALLEQKWDKIFYTGGAVVGTIIAKKAAETLTPVTLELGGRNPAIITKNADVRLAAKRLLWGKIINAGQICISQNYTLVDKDVLDLFLDEMKAQMKAFFPNGTRKTEDYGRIINKRQWTRIKGMLDASTGKIILGGETDESDLYIAPTIILIDSPKDSLMTEESFGPLIPILPVSNLDEAIRIANENQETPLGLYPFGSDREVDRMLTEIRSGGASINDAFMHGTIPTFAFGGVGESGSGAYRGRASFDCFSHRRSITKTPGWMERLLAVRYPPYEGKLAQFRYMTQLKPNFDREGNVTPSLASFVSTLGARSKAGGFLRYLVVILAAIGAKTYFL